MASTNYTEEQEKMLEQIYAAQPNMDSVEFLAKELQKSKKSIIGKLSKMGIYRRQVYKTKLGDNPVTKSEIVAEIAASLDLTAETLEGLEKAPKQVLKRLNDAISE